MDWQLGLVGLCATLAVVYLGYRSWRTWMRKASGCGGGCSCPGKGAQPKGKTEAGGLISVEQLTLRLRQRG